ncbi:hypothetical protein BS329_13950 [Amycolatopsis coloradensis]|uniref:Uncharacterized protein n=1 Tax=Amycolatopsis coloradensis TaxID=76021 RepID=A0A1R0KUU3_9PSEU|nr:hypothetical protein [Amycolatopsis coloradensis]OLZ52422.1 hypothetical protein BS329_13950 [Amycolatopsis coloradensis]
MRLFFSAGAGYSHVVPLLPLAEAAPVRLGELLARLPVLAAMSPDEKRAYVVTVMAETGPGPRVDEMPDAIMVGGWRALDPIVRRFGLDPFPDHGTVPYLNIWSEALRPRGVTWDHPRPAAGAPGGGPARRRKLPGRLRRTTARQTVYVTAGTSHNTRPGVLEAMISRR